MTCFAIALVIPPAALAAGNGTTVGRSEPPPVVPGAAVETVRTVVADAVGRPVPSVATAGIVAGPDRAHLHSSPTIDERHFAIVPAAPLAADPSSG